MVLNVKAKIIKPLEKNPEKTFVVLVWARFLVILLIIIIDSISFKPHGF